MTWTTAITTLLSNHRQSQNSAQPLTLTRQQILSLLHYSAPPNSTDWQVEASRALDELQAQGEILAGMGKRYCIASPTVVALSQDNTTSLRFQGDRAYLPLVHQALKTGQAKEEVLLRPQISGFNRIQDALQNVGVRFLEISDSLQGLPCPRKPIVLQSPLEENPFVAYMGIDHYVPKPLKNQMERWQPRSSHSAQKLMAESLLRLPTGEYLWLSNGQFYELEPEAAVFAMFAQDLAAENPLPIEWDENCGRVNLQGIILPGVYARWLWRLSEPDPERYRTRLVPAAHRPFVKEAFTRLGCELV
ncbi:MAG: hypothetical protein HC852_04885 [Acaryochloridaceae cyanobacterium RU_4_10]|nr:hypothetical protein [Acaryochloridaceae cyanobacterium RU_4_10]